MTSPELAPPQVRARDRAGRILREPRLLVLLLAGGVMATIVVFVIGFSSALFTSSSEDPDNEIGAGEIHLLLSNGGEILNGAELKPGVTRTGTVTVTNREQKASVTVRVANLAETPPTGPSLADLLNVTVRETAPGTAVRFAGKLRELTTAAALGTWAAGQQRNIEIEVAWPLAEDSLTYANAKASFGFEWHAESVP